MNWKEYRERGSGLTWGTVLILGWRDADWIRMSAFRTEFRTRGLHNKKQWGHPLQRDFRQDMAPPQMSITNLIRSHRLRKCSFQHFVRELALNWVYMFKITIIQYVSLFYKNLMDDKKIKLLVRFRIHIINHLYLEHMTNNFHEMNLLHFCEIWNYFINWLVGLFLLLPLGE
jgi:hypothetical protein